MRQTQSRLDAKLTAYSQYVSDLARKNAAPSDAVSVDMSGSTPSVQDRAAMEAEIQALLVQYSDELDELGTTLNDPLLPPNNTQKHAIQRHLSLIHI